MDSATEEAESPPETVEGAAKDDISGEEGIKYDADILLLSTEEEEMSKVSEETDKNFMDNSTATVSHIVNDDSETNDSNEENKESVGDGKSRAEGGGEVVETSEVVVDKSESKTELEDSNEDMEDVEHEDYTQEEQISEDVEEDRDEVSAGESVWPAEEKEAVEITDELVSEDKNEQKDDELKEESVESETDDKKEDVKEEVEDEWVDILGNGLLKKKVVKAGKEGGNRPVAGQEVCIKSEGLLENGDKVDVFEDETFIMGDGDVITAWDLCVSTMVEGEICQLITAPRFAYGPLGKEDDHCNVPGDSEITYTLELVGIKPGPDISSLTDEQRLEIGDAKRERGNELFRREDFSQAVYSYQRALKYLEPSTSEEVLTLQVKCWNNIAASHLKVQEYVAANTACCAVLRIDSSNVKALFRKGKVLNAQGEYEEALELLRKANTLEPDNRLVRREFLLAKEKCDEERKKERDMYQRMVNGLGDTSKDNGSGSFFTWPVILGITGVALGGIIAALFFVKHQV